MFEVGEGCFWLEYKETQQEHWQIQEGRVLSCGENYTAVTPGKDQTCCVMIKYLNNNLLKRTWIEIQQAQKDKNGK